jgi:hypothetical protein
MSNVNNLTARAGSSKTTATLLNITRNSYSPNKQSPMSNRHTVAALLNTNDLFNQQAQKHFLATHNFQTNLDNNNSNSDSSSNWILTTNDKDLNFNESAASGGDDFIDQGEDAANEDSIEDDLLVLESSSSNNLTGGATTPTAMHQQNTLNSSAANFSQLSLFDEKYDDYTTKRLKTFVKTTLHNERVYLSKVRRLLDLKQYLEENFNGSQTDLIVLFTGIQEIYKAHDVVASKLDDYLNSISDLSSVVSHNSNSNNSSLATAVQMKESFLANALQLLANIMEISFPVYFDFLKNYPKAMTILNKLETHPQNNNNNNKSQSSSNDILLNDDISVSSTANSSSSKRKTFQECKNDFNSKLIDQLLIDNKKHIENSSVNNLNNSINNILTSKKLNFYLNV